MKNYERLTIPDDSAWGRWTIRRYIPNWLSQITDGIYNIFKWIPTIYKNKDWDSYFIYDVLKKKIEFQREYLIKHNRHLGIPETNYYMTVCLNLIERLQADFYALEYMDYHESRIEFEPNGDGSSELNQTILSERFDEYLSLYPLITNKIIKSNPDIQSNKHYLCLKVATENQKRCKKLLFKILESKVETWWD